MIKQVTVPRSKAEGSNFKGPAVLSPRSCRLLFKEVKPMITELVKRHPLEDPEASGWEAHVHI